MSAKSELNQFIAQHDDPKVLEALMDMIARMKAGESPERIAASYGVNLEEATA